MYHNMYNHISPCVECQGGCHGVSGPLGLLHVALQGQAGSPPTQGYLLMTLITI